LIEVGKDGSEARSLFHYDDWGNLIKVDRVDGKQSFEEQRVLRWDAENRLSAVTVKFALLAGDSCADRRLPFYAYSGREFDLESGYLHFGARYYDPTTFLRLNADPVNAGLKSFRQSSSNS
jgi:RHS repeat-associated protein